MVRIKLESRDYLHRELLVSEHRDVEIRDFPEVTRISFFRTTRVHVLSFPGR